MHSAVRATSLPDSVYGRDERVSVDPETSPPYNWISCLLITAVNGDQCVGSGSRSTFQI